MERENCRVQIGQHDKKCVTSTSIIDSKLHAKGVVMRKTSKMAQKNKLSSQLTWSPDLLL